MHHSADLNQNPEVLIDWFDDFLGPNRYSFLSNFYKCPVLWQDVMWHTTEHAFAAAKMDPNHPDGPEYAQAIMENPDPGVAKALGRRGPLRPDWEEIKFEVMREIVGKKFAAGSEMARLLDKTGDAYLQEGTLWGDTYWGVILDEFTAPIDRVGRNWLGIILMERRARNRITTT